MDRRLVHGRIGQLKQELKEVERHRELVRTNRKRNHVKVAALVGYSCAGKSSLENALTHADILEDDMLFSTLDTTTRLLKLPGAQEVLLTDTVGFIRKLPHHLIEAFKSTLEEAKYADIIIHVVDASNPQMDMQMAVVYETLKELGVDPASFKVMAEKCSGGGARRLTGIRELDEEDMIRIYEMAVGE